MKRLEIIVNEYPWRTDGKFDVTISEQPGNESVAVSQNTVSDIDSYSEAMTFVDKHLQILKACERTRPQPVRDVLVMDDCLCPCHLGGKCERYPTCCNVPSGNLDRQAHTA